MKLSVNNFKMVYFRHISKEKQINPTLNCFCSFLNVKQTTRTQSNCQNGTHFRVEKGQLALFMQQK